MGRYNYCSISLMNTKKPFSFLTLLMLNLAMVIIRLMNKIMHLRYFAFELFSTLTYRKHSNITCSAL